MSARWAVEGDWKLIVPGVAYVESPKRKPELYDLKADPHETRNLAAGQPGVVKRLGTLLDEWWPPGALEPHEGELVSPTS